MTAIRFATRRAWDAAQTATMICAVAVALVALRPALPFADAPDDRLEARLLSFEDGAFVQLVVPAGPRPVVAHWTAAIWEGPRLVCAGRGWAVYEPKVVPLRMSPKEWVMGACTLLPGMRYAAEATWCWRIGEDTRCTGARFTFRY